MMRAFSAIVCTALLACPGGGAGTGASEDGGVKPDTTGTGAGTQLCDAHLTWDMGCAAMEAQPRDEPFWGATECLTGPWHYVHPRYLDAAAECFESLSCDSSDDACTTAGLAALGIDDAADLAGDALFQRCRELATNCDALSEDACLEFAVFTEEGRRKAAPCLDIECSAVQGCLLQPD